MNIKVTNKIDSKSYDRVVEMLVDFNKSKTEHLKNEINQALEIIASIHLLWTKYQN